MTVQAADAIAGANAASALRPIDALGLPLGAAVALLVLTAVFDNVMIAAGLFTYPSEHLSGLRVGLAPIEDFSYPLAAAFLVPAVWTLWGREEPA